MENRCDCDVQFWCTVSWLALLKTPGGVLGSGCLPLSRVWLSGLHPGSCTACFAIMYGICVGNILYEHLSLPWSWVKESGIRAGPIPSGVPIVYLAWMLILLRLGGVPLMGRTVVPSASRSPGAGCLPRRRGGGPSAPPPAMRKSLETLIQGALNQPPQTGPNSLVFKPSLWEKNLEWCYKKMASGKEITCFWKVVSSTMIFCLWALFSQSWRWGDVGHVFFFCFYSGLDGHRDPQLLQTLEFVGIAVGGCVFFHSVVLHRNSVVVRGFPSGFTTVPQIFGVDFLRPSKKVQKEPFWVRYVLGRGFFGCSTQCRLYFCSILRVRSSIRFGALGLSLFWGAVIFVFLRGEKSNLGVGKNSPRCGWIETHKATCWGLGICPFCCAGQLVSSRISLLRKVFANPGNRLRSSLKHRDWWGCKTDLWKKIIRKTIFFSTWTLCKSLYCELQTLQPLWLGGVP